MTYLFLSRCFALLACGALVACSTTSTSPKSRTVYQITETTVNPKAYHEPKVAAAGNGDAIAVAIGGLVGTGIGAAIDHSVQSAEQKKFDRQHSELLVFENRIDIENLRTLLDQKMQSRRERNAESDNSRGNLWLEIGRYGLFVAADNSGHETLLQGSIGIRIRAQRSDGPIVTHGAYYGYSTKSYQINEYIEDPNLANEVLKEALLKAYLRVSQRLTELRI